MNVTAWLEAFEPAFAKLSEDEREAIDDFSRLWSFYEGKMLEADAKLDAFIETAQKLRDCGALTLGPLAQPIAYFRDRYFRDGRHTWHFHDLKFRNEAQKQRAARFVDGTAADDVEVLVGLLLVVFRLRNNLFHGAKWADGIHGQLPNFENANCVLAQVLEMHRNAGLG
jgi:hypothetical protein